MSEIDENLRNSFQWIKQLYKFSESFSQKVTSLMNEKQLYRLGNETFYTTLSAADSSNWLLRALGNVYSPNPDLLKSEIPLGIELPFFIFRFTGDINDTRVPMLIYGKYFDLKIETDRYPEKWRLLRHIVKDKYFSQLESNPTYYKFEKKGSSHSIDCLIKPVSMWIEEEENEQEELIEKFTDELYSFYSQ